MCELYTVSADYKIIKKNYMDRSIIEDKGINAVSEYLSDIGYIKP